MHVDSARCKQIPDSGDQSHWEERSGPSTWGRLVAHIAGRRVTNATRLEGGTIDTRSSQKTKCSAVLSDVCVVSSPHSVRSVRGRRGLTLDGDLKHRGRTRQLIDPRRTLVAEANRDTRNRAKRSSAACATSVEMKNTCTIVTVGGIAKIPTAAKSPITSFGVPCTLRI